MTCRFGLVLAGALLGCSDDADSETTAPPCAEWLRDDGVCAPPGLPPDMPCPPGEWSREGECLAAGVPADGCGMGFVHDGDRGCEAILPAGPCADALMAVPGETSCGQIAPCASGTWGAIRVEPNTEYVDRSYTGGASDGSQAAPWTTIQAGVDEAAPGAIVAVARGSYQEDVTVQGKAVRLWGTCSSDVQLAGMGNAPAALVVLTGADGTEVRGIAITGQSGGVAHTGSEDVRLHEVRIHDTAGRGISSEDAYGATSMVLHRVLVERAHGLGVNVNGAEVTLDATVVRDTAIGAQGSGRGINVQDGFVSGARAMLRVTRSLVEGNGELGVFVGGSDAIIDTAVIRDTLPDAQGDNGRGMSMVDNPMTAVRATAVVTTSLIERNHGAGIFVEGSDLTVEATVVRETWSRTTPGIGIAAEQNGTTGGRAKLDVATSLVEGSQGLGMLVMGADAIVNATAVRHTGVDALGEGGRGLQAQDNPATGARATVAVSASLFEHNIDHGLFIAGSDASLEAVWVRETPGLGAGTISSAFQVQRRPESGAPGSATLRACLLERSAYAGIAVVGPASVDVEACTLRDTTMVGGLLGDGILVLALDGAADASVVGTRIEHSQRAAVSSFGAGVALGSSRFVCQAFDIASEAWMGSAPLFDDRGGNTCGCPEATAACLAQSYALASPDGIE